MTEVKALVHLGRNVKSYYQTYVTRHFAQDDWVTVLCAEFSGAIC
jgi:hypothetical protein